MTINETKNKEENWYIDFIITIASDTLKTIKDRDFIQFSFRKDVRHLGDLRF